MRYVAVKRVAILLAAIFLLWAGVFAWVVRRKPGSEPAATAAPTLATGAALFERHCASCHAPEDLRPALRDGGETARRELELFLENHGDSSGDEDRRLVEYLTGAGLQ